MLGNRTRTRAAEAKIAPKTTTATTRVKTTSAVHYNPPQQSSSHIDIDVDDGVLSREHTNEFINRFSKSRQRQQQQQQPQKQLLNRHSTGGATVIYTHPSTLAMLTLNKRASDVGVAVGASDGILVGANELLTTRQRHQRDLFSGDLGIPPIPPPPPLSHAHMRQTHVGNVVQTFETLAMQRRLATLNQQKQQQQQQHQLKYRQQQKITNTFSKYLKDNIKFSIFKSKQQQHQGEKVYDEEEEEEEEAKHAQQEANVSRLLAIKTSPTQMPIITNKNKNNNNMNRIENATNIHILKHKNTFNERNKQISEQQLQQMDIDYRKNLFSTHSHININNNSNNNNNNNNTISTCNNNSNIIDDDEIEAGVVAVFDEMLAGYSATDDDYDDAKLIPNYEHDNEVLMLKNSSHLSIININGNEAQDNVLHINLRSTNTKPVTTTITNQLNESDEVTTNSQRVLPIIRKKTTAPPVPPPKPIKSLTKTMAMQTSEHKSLCKARAVVNSANFDKENITVDNEVSNTNDFLRGSTLSQSFVQQTNCQQNKKARAPKPPILPITTPNALTQLRISLTNPLWEKLRLNTKRTHSFNLLK